MSNNLEVLLTSVEWTDVSSEIEISPYATWYATGQLTCKSKIYTMCDSKPEDQRQLDAGEITPEELRDRNSMFPRGMKFKINFDNVKSFK